MEKENNNDVPCTRAILNYLQLVQFFQLLNTGHGIGKKFSDKIYHKGQDPLNGCQVNKILIRFFSVLALDDGPVNGSMMFSFRFFQTTLLTGNGHTTNLPLKVYLCFHFLHSIILLKRLSLTSRSLTGIEFKSMEFSWQNIILTGENIKIDSLRLSYLL